MSGAGEQGTATAGGQAEPFAARGAADAAARDTALNAMQRDGTPAAKVPESVRWWLRGLEHTGQIAVSHVIAVCDREGDMWDLVRTARQTGNGLVVRSDRGSQRRVAVDGNTRELWDFLDAQPVLGTETITINPCGGPRKRREC